MRAAFVALLLLVACGEDPTKSDTGADAGCDAASDADNDGLDDCAEAELGTDPASADTDGDGLTDAEEADCVSDPLDAGEQCYACGWEHNDPDTLAGTGADLGDTVADLSFVDQCEETVALYDFAGSYTVAFMTAAWCPMCMEEAGGLADAADALASETGEPVQGLVLLYQGRSGSTPTVNDVIPYATDIGAETTPVLGDVDEALLDAVPYDGSELPGVCLLSPTMELLACSSGEGQVPTLADAISAHAR